MKLHFEPGHAPFLEVEVKILIFALKFGIDIEQGLSRAPTIFRRSKIAIFSILNRLESKFSQKRGL